MSRNEKITDRGLDEISKVLRGLTLLKAVSLYFSDCTGIFDNGLQNIVHSLDELVALQRLDIQFLS